MMSTRKSIFDPPPHIHMHPPKPDPYPLFVGIINGWPLISDNNNALKLNKTKLFS